MHADAFSSEPRARKLNSELADDRVRRTRMLSVWINNLIRSYKPDLIAAEAMSFPKSQTAIVCISLAWGVLATLVEMWKMPLVTSAPWRARKDLVPVGQAVDAHRVALRAVPTFADRARGIDRDLQAHAYDALHAWKAAKARTSCARC